jgi:acylphosphatase
VTERIALKVRLFGRVQGVFFRQWTIDQARALGVAGWVHNRSDGSLEAHLEGEEPAVTQLVERMRTGPSQARVDDVMVQHAAPEDIEGFAVKL